MEVDEEELLYEETPEMTQETTLKLLEVLLKNQPPYSLTRDDIYCIKDAVCIIQERLIEASKTILTEEELLGIESQISDGIENMQVEENNEKEDNSSRPASYSASPSGSSERSKSESVEPQNDKDHEIDFIDTDEEDNIAQEKHVGYMSYISKDRKFLKLRKTDSFSEANFDKISYPLGVVYDEITCDWFICEKKDMLIRIPKSDHRHRSDTKILENRLIRNPSALAILREGHAVALLSSKVMNTATYWISVYQYGPGRGKGMMHEYCSYKDSHYKLDYPCRGLARSVGNNMITLDLPPAPRSARLRILTDDGKQVAYTIVDSRRPSFIASHLNRVAISDLGSQAVYLLRVDDSNWDAIERDPRSCISILRMIDPKEYTMTRLPRNIADIGHFNFVAGLQFDRDGYLLIGDAGGHTIKLFDPNLKLIHRVSTDFPIPYMSSFYVNGKGQVLMIDLRGRQRFVFAKLRSSSTLLPWINTSHPPKMTERRNTYRNFSR